MSSLPIDRWIITGALTLLEPLSIHTGGTQIIGQDEGETALIELDFSNKPFIPATGFKGLLRALTSDTAISKHDLETLLGGQAENRGNDNAQLGLGGAAEIGQGWLKKSGEIGKRGQTAIHHGTGAKQDTMLRQEQFVCPGAQFEFEIILDRASRNSAELFLGMLALIDGKSQKSALGSHKGQGFGRVRWAEREVKHLGKVEIEAWLKTDKPWRDCAEVIDLKPTTLIPTATTERLAIDMALNFGGHFMSMGGVKKRGDVDVKQPFSTKSGTPQLMGSGVDGPLYHQAAKIWRTLSGDKRIWKSTDLPAPLQLLFGSTKQKGLLSLSIFEGAAATPVEQEFVALDRFHGGASGGAKFVVAAYEAPVLNGKFELTFVRKPNRELTGKSYASEQLCLTPASLGLLALTLWDLDEGDIRFGFGTRKGWGQTEDIGLHAVLDQVGQKALDAGLIQAADARQAIGDCITAFRKEAAAYVQSQTQTESQQHD